MWREMGCTNLEIWFPPAELSASDFVGIFTLTKLKNENRVLVPHRDEQNLV